jgi:acetyl-CoA carboxylase biotin carboxylase subunit
MFKKILIANRGEIAVRIIRACREMGIQTVAVYSGADKESMHVKLADEAVCIGRASVAETYLNIPEIIVAAKATKTDAVHPGYGLLSENHDFAENVQNFGLTFIGPSPDTLRRMGDKIEAIQTAMQAGVPVIPGSHGPVESDETALEIADSAGFPLLIKAAAGGGGKGMRIVKSRDELLDCLHAARNEAENYFGNDDIYIEKFIESGRHIEIQVLADSHGDVAVLGERDCSIQRRYQKLVEESPSPALSDKVRKKMFDAASRLTKAVKYCGAGTIEFLLNEDHSFYFMEMNTRIQVEHPVTEMVCGIDIVKHQIAVTAGEALGLQQKNICFTGHAIECRINAEDPFHSFFPSPGKIKHLYLPGGPGVRVDTHMYAGYHIPSHYDSLVAKLIVHDETRESAIERMHRALKEFKVDGIKTTIPLHSAIMKNRTFRSGDYSTRFMPEEFGHLL